MEPSLYKAASQGLLEGPRPFRLRRGTGLGPPHHHGASHPALHLCSPSWGVR